MGACGAAGFWELVNVCIECIGQSATFVCSNRTGVSAWLIQTLPTVRSNLHSTIDATPRSPLPRTPPMQVLLLRLALVCVGVGGKDFENFLGVGSSQLFLNDIYLRVW